MLSIITVPFDFSNSVEPAAYGNDIMTECHTEINSVWHACGVVKDYYRGQGCGTNFGDSVGTYDNHDGAYTTYIPYSTVAGGGSWHSGDQSSDQRCGTKSIWICCSMQCSSSG